MFSKGEDGGTTSGLMIRGTNISSDYERENCKFLHYQVICENVLRFFRWYLDEIYDLDENK